MMWSAIANSLRFADDANIPPLHCVGRGQGGGGICTNLLHRYPIHVIIRMLANYLCAVWDFSYE
jgi:hypothetical protein